jgi:hypothetical protein
LPSISTYQTDELSTGEGEGGSDEDAAEATEAVGEGARVVPQLRAAVRIITAALRTTAADQHNGHDHEDDDGAQLEEGGPELFLSVAKCTEDVDEDDGEPEYRDPYSCRWKWLARARFLRLLFRPFPITYRR